MADLDEEDQDEGEPSSAALALGGGGKGSFQYLPGVIGPSDLPAAPDLQPAPDIQTPSLGEEAGALGAGILRPIGGDRLLTTVGVKPETLKHLKEIAPGWSGTGQFIGSTIPSLAAAALSGGAAVPAIIGAQAAAGAATGLGEAISEDALGEAPLVAERTLAHVGLDALIGGATQGLFEGLGAGIPKAFEKFRAATVDADGALHDVASATAGNAIGSAVPSEPEEYGIGDFVRQAAKATDPAELAREVEFQTKGAKAAVMAAKEEAYGNLADKLGAVVDSQDAAHDAFQMQHVNQMRNVIPSDDATTNKAVQATADHLGALRGKIAEMRADPDTFTDKSLINQYEGQVNRYEAAIGKIDPRSPTAAGDLFNAKLDFRRSVDDKLPFDKLLTQARDQPLTGGRVASEILGMRHITTDALGDESTWGQAAKFFNETNAVQSARMAAESNPEKTGVFQLLGKQMANGEWRPDVPKIRSYLTKASKGQAESDLPMQSIGNWIEKLKAENDYMQGRYKLGGMQPVDDIGPAISALEEAQATAKTATDAAINFVKPKPGIAQQFERFAKGGKGEGESGAMTEAAATGLESVNRSAEAAERGAGGLGASVVGGLGAAGLGHMAAAGLAGLGAYKMIRGAIPLGIRVLGAIARHNNTVAQAVRVSAEDAISGTAESAGTRAAAERASDGLRGVDFSGGQVPAGETREAGAARIASQLQDFQINPEALPDRLSAALNQVYPHAPTIGTHLSSAAVGAALFLATKAPRDPLAGQTVAPDDWQPTASQAREFEHYVMGTVYPMRTLRRLGEGKASPQELEAVNTVYPALTADHKGAITARLIKNPGKIAAMPHQRVMRLSGYLGRPLDRTALPMPQTPASIPQAAPPPTARPKSLRSKLTLADRSKLSTDRGDE